jgi:uncharacterized protein
MQMEIDLTELEPDGVRVAETFATGQLVTGGDDRVEPLRAEIEAWVRPEKGLARASGRIRARVRGECDRCLKPTEVDLVADFDQRYTWDASAVESGEAEVDPSQLDIELLESPRLDVLALAREQFELAAPMHIVCAESCRGLCPVCHADRNEVSCACEADEIDPRWDALKNLKLN